jgi:hypothetical protein
VRHLARKILASPTAKDLRAPGSRVVLIWISCALTFPMYQKAEPAWHMLSGPFVAALADPVYSAVQKTISLQELVKNFVGQVLASCGSVVYCMPLRCSINKHVSVQPQLFSWLKMNQQRQQELCEALSDFRYRQFLWAVFATAEQRVYELAKGRSQLLGCKLPQVRLEEQWSDRHEAFAEMSGSKLEETIRSLWSCFKGHYLIMPAEGALAYLLHQQQQEGVDARCGTSKNKTSNSSWGGVGAAMRAGAMTPAMMYDFGESLRLVWLQSLAQRYKSRFDVGCLWLFHQPGRPRNTGSTQPYGGAARKKGAQDLGQAAASSGPDFGKGLSSAAAAAGDGGGDERCTPSDGVEGGQTGGVSITQLRVMVNMLLLLWPRLRSSGARQYEGAERLEVPVFSLEEQCWDGLLVLAALLQQAPAEAKQQFMKDHGTLLLQLLYHVLLDHEAMGKRGLKRAQVLPTVDNLEAVLKEVHGSWGQEDRIGSVSWTAEPMSVVQLVLMVVQSLVFVVDMSGPEFQAGTLLGDGLGIAVRGGKPG